MTDTLARDLTAALADIPLIDPHSHIDPLSPAVAVARRHPRLPLLHRAGPLRRHDRRPRSAKDVPPRDRVPGDPRATWTASTTPSSTPGSSRSPGRSSASTGDRVTAADADALFDAAEKTFAQPDWEQQVFAKSNLEKIFLTNEFDDPLDGFDTDDVRPVPADRHLVFHLDKPAVTRAAGEGDRHRGRRRGQRCARRSRKLFEHFTRKGAKACAISLPPDFAPAPVDDDVHRPGRLATIRGMPATCAAAASSGCSPSTAASSSCRST